MRSLRQTFRFRGATADDLARVLADAPWVGDRSIFGHRAVRSAGASGETREIIGFEPLPVPLIRFDVKMSQQRAESHVQVLIEFSQPQRKRPYLAGQFVWLLSDEDGDALLQEEINTPVALGIVDRPLHGRGWSLRRYLFFAGGHERLMKDVEANVRALLD